MKRHRCQNLEELEEELHRRRRLRRQSSIFTHELIVLVNLLDCQQRMRDNQALWRQFALVNRWAPAWRYSADLSTERDAVDFVEAVENIYRWLRANT